jgi:hypothetical protein
MTTKMGMLRLSGSKRVKARDKERPCLSGLAFRQLCVPPCAARAVGPHVAVSGQDRSLIVPAEVALYGLDLLALHGAGQGVGAACTKELAASAHLQFSLDRTGIHRHLLHIA